MTVRLNPTESDSPPPQVTAPPEGVAPAPGATAGDVPERHDRDGRMAPAADSRRSLRESRRQRRRAMWLCAAVVALCLALTIVVVTLARSRPVGPPAAWSATPSAVVRPAATAVDRVMSAPAPSRGAAAPEGGNP